MFCSTRLNREKRYAGGVEASYGDAAMRKHAHTHAHTHARTHAHAHAHAHTHTRTHAHACAGQPAASTQAQVHVRRA